jgi:excisionase family DNA binding protein
MSNIQENLKQYLSVPELAKRWECDEKLVYQEIAAKHLTGLRIGKKLLRVSLAEVERYEVDYQTSKEAA